MRSFLKLFMAVTLTTVSLFACDSGMAGLRETGSEVVVDMSAARTLPEKPVAVNLPAGNYSIRSIGRNEGGAYDAWKAWMWSERKDAQGGWKIGWLNFYYLSSDEFPETRINDETIYGSEAAALAGAAPSGFTLSRPGTVRLYFRDSPAFDNDGGVSLIISPVP